MGLAPGPSPGSVSLEASVGGRSLHAGRPDGWRRVAGTRGGWGKSVNNSFTLSLVCTGQMPPPHGAGTLRLGLQAGPWALGVASTASWAEFLLPASVLDWPLRPPACK